MKTRQNRTVQEETQFVIVNGSSGLLLTFQRTLWVNNLIFISIKYVYQIRWHVHNFNFLHIAIINSFYILRIRKTLWAVKTAHNQGAFRIVGFTTSMIMHIILTRHFNEIIKDIPPPHHLHLTTSICIAV